MRAKQHKKLSEKNIFPSYVRVIHKDAEIRMTEEYIKLMYNDEVCKWWITEERGKKGDETSLLELIR